VGVGPRMIPRLAPPRDPEIETRDQRNPPDGASRAGTWRLHAKIEWTSLLSANSLVRAPIWRFPTVRGSPGISPPAQGGARPGDRNTDWHRAAKAQVAATLSDMPPVGRGGFCGSHCPRESLINRRRHPTLKAHLPSTLKGIAQSLRRMLRKQVTPWHGGARNELGTPFPEILVSSFQGTLGGSVLHRVRGLYARLRPQGWSCRAAGSRER
jgi:hypothetical protein